MPLFVLANGGGTGYGLFLLDDVSRQYLTDHIEDIPDVLVRGEAWVDLWENLLEGRGSAGGFLTAAMRALPKETDQQNIQYILGRTGHAWWKFPAAGTTHGSGAGSGSSAAPWRRPGADGIG